MFRSGQMVGLYTLIEKLGRGGFGEVWLAEKRSQFITKKVAVKLPHEEQINFDAITQEATLWEQASGHPNVLPIIDADVYNGQVVIVSEYADGGSLADKLKREEKLPFKLAVEMTIGILSGLEFLHSRKIIHRDIKPQNILLQGNTPRLADFGISRAMNTTIVSSAIIGTDAYMSPESFDGKRNAQTDIWSVGVVLYQLLKGSLPFPQEHPSERMFAVLTKEFERLPEDVPADLRRIVGKALQKQPENRFQTAEEMREDLQKALIGIAHPTYAQTEYLIKPDLSEYERESKATVINPNAASIQQPAGRFEVVIPTEEPEIQTIFNPQPFANNAPENQLAPTVASYPANSVATELNRTPVTENQAQATGYPMYDDPQPSPPRQKTKSYEYAIIIIVGGIIVLGIIGFMRATEFVNEYSTGYNSNYNAYSTSNANSNYAIATNSNYPSNYTSSNMANRPTNATSSNYSSNYRPRANSNYSSNYSSNMSSTNSNTRIYNTNVRPYSSNSNY